ncbi:MAG: glycosyltransferase family 2 protein, partial [Hyphomicrobiaceae bacterium]
ERTIRSVGALVSDLVVVDSGSTDATVAIAEGLGARIFHRDWDGYGPQKRFSEECAEHDWILNLDADEVLTPELCAEIEMLFAEGEPELPAYRFRLLTVYPHHETPRPLADYHNYVRVYDRRKVRFRESLVHDTVDTGDYPVGQLRGKALHFSFRSIQHFAEKFAGYTTLQAREIRKPEWVLTLRQPIEYPAVFLRTYLLKSHWTGGWYGVRISHITARERMRRIGKIRNAQRQERAAASRANGEPT